jgi:flagellar hook-associated protein 1 FlgK
MDISGVGGQPGYGSPVGYFQSGTLVTMDDWYDSMVSQVGVIASKNRFTLSQEKDVLTQLNKIREQVSGVSIDEETANLMQFQHAFDASAKVVQVADEMLKTILSMR